MLLIASSQFDESDAAGTRGDLVSALVQHVGAGASGDARAAAETHAALAVLVRLAERRRSASALLGLWSNLFAMIEYIEQLRVSHARLVYRVFVALSDGQSAGAESARRELSVLSNKQLNSVELAFKRLGVLSCVALVCRCAPRFEAAAREDDDDDDDDDDNDDDDNADDNDDDVAVDGDIDVNAVLSPREPADVDEIRSAAARRRRRRQRARRHAHVGERARDEATAILRRAFERSAARPLSLAFLCDELARAVPSLSASMHTELRTLLAQYAPPLVDCDVPALDAVTARGNEASVRRVELYLGSVGALGNAATQLRVCDVLTATRRSDADALALAPALRLGAACGGVDANAALRAPVRLFAFDEPPIEQLPASERTTRCAMLCAALDWLREAISCAARAVVACASWAAGCDELDVVRRRVSDIDALERVLERYLRATRRFVSPAGAALAPPTVRRPRAKPAPSKRTAAIDDAAERATKKRADADDNDDNDDNNEGDATSAKWTKKSKPAKVAKTSKKAKRRRDDDDADDDTDTATNDDDDDRDEQGNEENEDDSVDKQRPAKRRAPTKKRKRVRDTSAAAAVDEVSVRVEAGESRPLVAQLRPAMRELDLAVAVALAHRMPVDALVIVNVLDDVRAKLLALTARASPLLAASAARARTQRAFEAFLSAHTLDSALDVLMPTLAALPVHAARAHQQLRALLRERDAESALGVSVDDERAGSDDDANNNGGDDDDAARKVRVELTLPGGVPELLACDAASVEAALTCILRTLSVVLRAVSSRAIVDTRRDTLLTELALTAAGSDVALAARTVFDRLAAFARALTGNVLLVIARELTVICGRRALARRCAGAARHAVNACRCARHE
jgi:hypothetical protein